MIKCSGLEKIVMFSNSDNILESRADAVVCPVNCVGVMGAGLAKKFAKKYPNYLADYKVACVLNQIRIGMVAVSISSVTKAPYTIISLPTKKHYSEKSDLQDIADALVSMISQHRMNYFSAEHIAVPAIGCGLGGLVWDDVLHIIRAASIFSKVPFHVYPPQ